jgi:hypothetical protein
VPVAFTDADSTLAEADFDRAEPAWPLMTEANFWPFCSTEIFFAAEVDPLKKASQLAVIALTAVELPPDAGELPGAAELGAADVAVTVAAGGLELPLEHAASTAIEIPGAAARMNRRAG